MHFLYLNLVLVPIQFNIMHVNSIFWINKKMIDCSLSKAQILHISIGPPFISVNDGTRFHSYIVFSKNSTVWMPIFLQYF